MELQLLTNLNPIGPQIASLLRSGQYKSFNMAVAYAKNSGVGRLYDDLATFANQGGTITAVIGIDQSITSYQALVNLSNIIQTNLYIHHDKGAITFHPKIYSFGNKQVERVFIGSSNLTAGGLYINFEANVGITLDNSETANKFRKEFNDYWQFLLNDVNTKSSDNSFIYHLLELGYLADETKQTVFSEIIDKVSGDAPFISRKQKETKHNQEKMPPPSSIGTPLLPSPKLKFAMQLSEFDVSPKSSDAVQLIPKDALKIAPAFWNWPSLYTLSPKNYPQFYAIGFITIDGKLLPETHLRIYYYATKKEFRLQCKDIKRNGHPGDIILIEKNELRPLEFHIELLRINSAKYKEILPLLTQKARNSKTPDKPKLFGYF